MWTFVGPGIFPSYGRKLCSKLLSCLGNPLTLLFTSTVAEVRLERGFGSSRPCRQSRSSVDEHSSWSYWCKGFTKHLTPTEKGWGRGSPKSPPFCLRFIPAIYTDRRGRDCRVGVLPSFNTTGWVIFFPHLWVRRGRYRVRTVLETIQGQRSSMVDPLFKTKLKKFIRIYRWLSIPSVVRVGRNPQPYKTFVNSLWTSEINV